MSNFHLSYRIIAIPHSGTSVRYISLYHRFSPSSNVTFLGFEQMTLCSPDNLLPVENSVIFLKFTTTTLILQAILRMAGRDYLMIQKRFRSKYQHDLNREPMRPSHLCGPISRKYPRL